MLQNIRDRAQGWIAWTIISLLCVTFALWGLRNYRGFGNHNGVAARVNGTDIPESLFARSYRQMQRQQQALLGSSYQPDEATEKQFKHQALEQLINFQLLVQAALKEGFRIGPDQLDAFLMSLPDFQVDGRYSPARFQALMASSSYTEEQFLRRIQQQMLTEQVQLGLSGTGFALPHEVDALIKLMNQTRDVGYITFTAKQLDSGVSVSKEEIAAYYEQHKDDYMLPEKLQLAYVKLSAEDLVKNFEGADANLKAEAQFADQSEQLANLSYEDPDSLDTVSETLDLPIQTTAFFTQAGEGVTGILTNPAVIAAAFGEDVHDNNYNSAVISLDPMTQVVVRVQDRKPATYQPMSALSRDISKVIQQSKEHAKMKALGDNIAEQLKAGVPGKEVAAKYNLTWKENKTLTRQASTLSSALLQAAFMLPKPEDSKHPSVDTVMLSPGNYAVLALMDVKLGSPDSASPSEKQRLSQNLAEANGQMDYDLYVQGLRDRAKIKRY